MRPLNLAARPFRNERALNLAMAAAWVAALGLSTWHGVAVWRLLPARTSALHTEVASLESEAARLRSEATEHRDVRPEAGAVARWGLIKDVVDRRALAWTALFGDLEDAAPDGVRLVSIAPTASRQDIALELAAVARSPEDGWEFIRRLEDHPAFSDVYPTSEGEGGEFRYTLRYRPAPRIAASASSVTPPPGGPSPGRSPGPSPSPEAEVER